MRLGFGIRADGLVLSPFFLMTLWGLLRIMGGYVAVLFGVRLELDVQVYYWEGL